jgi:predicted metal-dependent phosphoesterase TrpH
MIIGDFHTHINGGGNREQNAISVATMAKNNGCNHIALGCHEWLCPIDLANKIEKHVGIKVIRFAECWCGFDNRFNNTYDAHVLALNIAGGDEFYKIKYKPIEYYIDRIYLSGGKAVLAHPDSEAQFNEVKVKLDGVEVENGRGGWFQFTMNSGLTLFHNSDFHVWEDDAEEYMKRKICTQLPDNWFD